MVNEYDLTLGAECRGRHRDRRILAAILLGALAVRSATSYLWPNINHPDETFQYLEQAYRLVTGRGLVPWEYGIGARSWLLAWSIVPLVAFIHALTPDPALLRIGINLFLSTLSLIGVAAAYRIGRIAGGDRHALFAALLTGFWCEIVFMSPHMLADNMAALLLMTALASGARGSKAGRAEVAASGLLFGLTVIVRPQLAPACGLAMLWIAGLRPGMRWLTIAGAFLVPLSLLGITDWISWSVPFHSITTYLYVNSSGIADLFGVEPWSAYASGEIAIWGVATPAILLTAALGARRAPLVAATALVILATFSAVPHKEWRFIYPTLPVLFTLCGIGTADLIRWLSTRTGKVGEWRISYLATALWLALSLLSGVRGSMRPLWLQGGDVIRALDLANADPAACGLGIDPPNKWEQAGMVRIREDIRLYGAEFGSIPSFNYLLSVAAAGQPRNIRAPGFSQVACFSSGACLSKRAGGCRPGEEIVARPSPAVAARLRELATR